MPFIYHITKKSEADHAAIVGNYQPKFFERDGFIHCSFAQQVAIVANSNFSGQTDLVLLEIDPKKLKAKVVNENLVGGQELFPHIYGALNMDAVVRVLSFASKQDGYFEFSVEASD